MCLLSKLAKRLLLCVYLRRPGLKFLSTTNNTPSLLTSPARPIHRHFKNSISKLFQHSEFNRLGPSIFIGLSSSSESVREMTLLASCSLAVHHPLACILLLPLIAGLSQGRLEDGLTGGLTSISWGKFVSQRHLDFYLGLLHFFELLVKINSDSFDRDIGVYVGSNNPNINQSGHKSVSILFSSEAEKYSSSIDCILANLIHVVACYPHHARKMSSFTLRLSRLLHSYAAHASWAHQPGSLMGNLSSNLGQQSSASQLWQTRKEMLHLADVFNELSTLPALIYIEKDESTVRTTYSRKFSYLPVPIAPLKSAKYCHPSLLRPFVKRLHFPSSSADVFQILKDLDKLSERKLDVLINFKNELEYLVVKISVSSIDFCLPFEDNNQQHIISLALKLLFRLLRTEPQLAEESIRAAYLPCLLHSTNKYSYAMEALVFLPDACLLAPHLSHRLLHLAAIICIVTGETAIVAINESLLRLSLDGLDVACIEYAASGLLSVSNGPKFTQL